MSKQPEESSGSDEWSKMPRRPGGPPPLPRRGGSGWAGRFLGLLLIAVIVYGGYFWAVRRVVVKPGYCMILLKKNGTQSLEGDGVIIPAPPDMEKDRAGYDAWEKQYGNTNGILEKVWLPGTYFGFSPFDYERDVVRIAEVPNGKIGLVVRKFGDKLPPGQVLADVDKPQRGPLPIVLQPGQYAQFSNPHAYTVRVVDPVIIEPGHRGVVTIMAGPKSAKPNEYLVADGEQGTQRGTEPEGFRYVNLFQKRITPISIQSQRFEMKGDDAIRFPSADSFEIRMEGFVEWSIIPEKVPLIYAQYAEGGQLLEFMEEKVILPYSRSFSRLVGSQYTARDFIAGDTKLRFQAEFERRLREACEKQGIEILQALVRDIVPPQEIKDPINEREVARQQIKSFEQQILVAKSSAALATQTETATQNQKIGEANKQVVTIIKASEQTRGVALTKAQQDLAVAKLRLEAAQRQAEATVAKGQAEANVILLKKQAEAEPLKRQIAAFGDGNAYAQYFFYLKTAPAVKSIMATTDGPFGDLFRQFAQPLPATRPSGLAGSR